MGQGSPSAALPKGGKGAGSIPGRRTLNLYVVLLSEMTDEGKPTGGFCYYVGRTSKARDERFRQHQAQGAKSAKWCRRHKPLRLIEEATGSQFQELALTLEYMFHKGVDKVRGATYCRVVLLASERAEIDRHIAAANFALSTIQSRLSSRKEAKAGVRKCGACRLPGHTRATCPALAASPAAPSAAAAAPGSTAARGSGSSSAARPRSQVHCGNCGLMGHNRVSCTERAKPFSCFRCGREGHGVPQCNALLHRDKTPL
jgi:predicted GIY-YIG superfamily endonuclease